MRVIIAIDIIEGKCVRLTKGDFSTKKIYNEDPVEVARELEDNGIKYLHLVDLDGAREKRIINYRVLEKISAATDLVIDFGGGIRADDDVKAAFNAGALQVTAGSIAATDSDLFLKWLMQFGTDRIILGADCRERKVVVSGWTESVDEDIKDYISNYSEKGVRYAICTDIDRDGMLKGPSTELYKEIAGEVKINLIASGGISSLKDLVEINEAGCEGAIIGKAIYENRIKLKEIRDIC
ncbi:MAG TPA: 1-(5-phosphoribosyl)-5-[(5-phosphoribosylamino)methylideneamino]imidazole-4-carboxamide isomerase [Bacteroidales bacterium]|nr:1-(5-phosphoribosyl)-5-[(5-phosphoribosylamino)methylideneamino]imidazole-4-carboxamide isomerase [Bacteroidales bacterium]